jgi:hypothetical protein
MSHLHVVWPENVDDPRRPSGGNVYDRELQAALEEVGVTVHEHHDLRGVPDGSDVLLDGLLGLADPESIVRELGRLRVLLLVHLPLTLAHPGDPVVAEREARALAAADGVVTTSHWTRRWLLASDRLRVRETQEAVDEDVAPVRDATQVTVLVDAHAELLERGLELPVVDVSAAGALRVVDVLRPHDVQVAHRSSRR